MRGAVKTQHTVTNWFLVARWRSHCIEVLSACYTSLLKTLLSSLSGLTQIIPGSRKWLSVGFAATVLLALTCGVQIGVPELIRKQIFLGFEQACDGCTLSITRVHLSVFPLTLFIDGIRLRAGNPQTTAVTASIERLTAGVSLRRLLSGELHLTGARIISPHVNVTEGDLPMPDSKPDAVAGPELASFTIEDTRIVDGMFSYTRVYRDRTAHLQTRNLQGMIGPVGSIAPLRNQLVRAQVIGRLENSGEFHLTVITPLFSEDPRVDVDIKISEQNLADVSTFFEKSGGIKLSGSLYQGHGLMQIRKTTLRGWVRAQYRGLKIDMQKTKERSPLAAFFSNLVISVKLSSSNIKKQKEEQIRAVELQRKSDETILQLILRGLQEAALDVAAR